MISIIFSMIKGLSISDCFASLETTFSFSFWKTFCKSTNLVVCLENNKGAKLIRFVECKAFINFSSIRPGSNSNISLPSCKWFGSENISHCSFLRLYSSLSFVNLWEIFAAFKSFKICVIKDIWWQLLLSAMKFFPCPYQTTIVFFSSWVPEIEEYTPVTSLHGLLKLSYNKFITIHNLANFWWYIVQEIQNSVILIKQTRFYLGF